jgi:hypothetical protein
MSDMSTTGVKVDRMSACGAVLLKTTPVSKAVSCGVDAGV